MYVISGRNVNDAYPQGLQLLRRFGERMSSRAGDVLVMPTPVTTVYERPEERVLFDPVRDANPAFHLFESMWMLAGRNDAEFLNRFVGDFGDRFAEENGTLHGAYGRRWREYFGGDQLQVIIDRLRANPDDRRIVLQMWDPIVDLGMSYKDVPCLAGDTLLWSPEGDRPIAEVSQLFEEGKVSRWPVYSVDVKTKALRLSWATNVWRSGRKKLIRLRFDDGSSIRLTADHILYRRGRAVSSSVPVAAGSLKPGDRVLATQRWVSKKGYEIVKKELGLNISFSNLQKTHVSYAELVYGPIPKGSVVHHVNEHKTDNSADNLKVVTESWHNSYHRLGDRNPMRNLTPEQHKLRAKKQAFSISQTWSSLSSEERREHGRRSQAGISQEGRARRTESLRGFRHSEEAKARMSASARERWKRRKSLDNHVVIAVEECDYEDVYDFTVPELHTALIGTGVVAHNCNTQAYFRVRRRRVSRTLAQVQAGLSSVESVLDMTVCCRSNDIIWGAYGANAVHFSVLQEYMATRIGVGIGVYYQISNNFHAYLPVLDKVGNPAPGYDPYTGRDGVLALPMVTDPDRFDDDLRVFMEWTNNSWEEFPTLANPWFREVAAPMYRSSVAYKEKDWEQAFSEAQAITALDWKVAMLAWIKRRYDKAQSKV